MQFMKLIAMILSICLLSVPISGQMLHTRIEKKMFRSIHGVVLDVNGEAIKEARIEVLNHPEWIRRNQPRSPVEQHVIASSSTDSSGVFRIRDLSPGRYELRLSKIGFDLLHVYVLVNPRSRRSSNSGITLEMYVGI